MPVIVCIAMFFEFKTVEITEKLQILRISNRRQVHGRPSVIVYYTSMCTSIVLNLKKTFEISGLRHRFVWAKLYYLAQLTPVMKFKPTTVLTAFSYTFDIQLKFI